MDWFLYDKYLRHERVKQNFKNQVIALKNTTYLKR